MKSRRPDAAGYSLVEMLVVIAIIGVLALISVPSFMSMRNSAKMKAAMRTFTTDLRSVRQLAITHGRQVKLTYEPGPGKRTYDYLMSDRAYGVVPDANWTPMTGPGSVPRRETKLLADVVYFPANSAPTPQTFTDLNVTPDGRLDLIFFPDGRVQMPGSATGATVTIRTDMNVPKPLYQIQISPTGRVIAQ